MREMREKWRGEMVGEMGKEEREKRGRRRGGRESEMKRKRE